MPASQWVWSVWVWHESCDTVCRCLLTQQRVWCVDGTHLHTSLLTDTPTLQSFPLHTLLPSLTPGTLLLLPAQDENEVWLRSDHTHWLLSLQGDDLTSADETVGVVLVDESVREGEVWSDVRLEAPPTDTLTITHQQAGGRKVGVVYNLDVARGKPVRVSCLDYTDCM